jgi:DNA-binding IclR family transcriptional regulator
MGNSVSSTATTSSGSAGDYRSLQRAVLLLDQFDRKHQELGASELARLSGLNKGTTHRIAQALVSLRFLEQDPDSRQYRLGVRLLELGSMVSAGLDIRERAKPVLRRVTEQCGETTYLLLYREGHAVCVERTEGIHLLRDLATEVGSVLPLNVGAAPVAMLAHLPEEERRPLVEEALPAAKRKAFETELEEIRERGYAAVMDGIEEGHGGIAAPIYDRHGDVCAALSIGGLVPRLEANVDSLGVAAVAAAEEISRLMGRPQEGVDGHG